MQAFSHPLSGTVSAARREFSVGNSFFNLAWIASPSSTTARDGLGPVYNAVSCSGCHFKDGRGRGLPDDAGKTETSLLFRLKIKNFDRTLSAHPVYGGQFQPLGVLDIKGEGESRVRYEKIILTYTDGTIKELLSPIYEFIKLNFGSFGENTIVSPRVAPQVIGLGLVEAISESDILINEDPYDADGDGISGRANWVTSIVTNTLRLGRFGWKAGKSSLIEQNAAAFNGDMGITSPFEPEEECTSFQEECIRGRSAGDIPLERLQSVTSYTQLLSVPARREMNDPKVQNGRSVFHKINCIACHTPRHETSSDAPFEILKNQTIYPYSDFLLHDMGEALADDKEEFYSEELATTREWRTPPLWGLGLVQTVNGHTRYMHDGRARDLEEAVLWHGGEALESKNAFLNLNSSERENLILFLKSL